MSIFVLSLREVATCGVWGAQAAVHPWAAGLDHFGHEALGHERGLLLVLHSVALPPFARVLPCVVSPRGG